VANSGSKAKRTNIRSEKSPRDNLINALEETFKAKQHASDIPSNVIVRRGTEISGHVAAPPSKSYSHRALMVAGLSPSTTYIENPLIARDIIATAGCWSHLGANIRWEAEENRFRIEGVAQPKVRSNASLFIGESGTSLRFLLPGLAFANGRVLVKGKSNSSISKRQNRMIVRPLREQLGLKVDGKGSEEYVPVTVEGQGFLPVADLRLPGQESSQVISSFLLWLPLATPKRFGRRYSTIEIQGPFVSRPYVDVTRDVLSWGGVKVEPREDGRAFRIPAGQSYRASSSTYRVNGDYSSAAFLLAAAALTDSDVTVTGLKQDAQGDRAIVGILRRMGACIEERDNALRIQGPSGLQGIELDCSDTPDLVPILCVLAAFAKGRTRLTNIAHLRFKETDRLEAPTTELKKLGATISHDDSSITIEGSELRSAPVRSHGDHRMAMSMMVAGLRIGDLVVQNVPCIGKSYSTFIRDIQSLGGRIEAA